MKRKAFDISTMIRGEIEASGTPGERLDAVPALAARLGTSVNTILAAFQILERDGLIERKPGSGVYIKPQCTRAKTIGILVEHDILHPRCSVYWTQLVRELRLYLAQKGLQTNLYIGEVPYGTVEPERVMSRHFLNDLGAGRFDGAMLVCTKVLPELTAALKASRVPVVGDTAAAPFHMSGNNTAIVEEGVRQLLAQGCRRIALMAWRTDKLIETFTRAMGAAGLPVVPEWVRHDLLPELTGAGWEEFREIWMARSEKPDGLLVMDDILFRDAMISIREMGISVPEQLRIVAHATRGADIAYPDSVVRLEVDPAENAKLMGGMMVRLLAGKPVRPSQDGAVGHRESRLAFRIVPARDVVVSAAGAARDSRRREAGQTV